MIISLSAFAPENLVSRNGFGIPVPRQPAHLHTQAESAAYLRDSSRVPWRRPLLYLKRHTLSAQSRVHRVTQLRTDVVHCLESTGTGPISLKVVPNEYSLSVGHHGPINMRLSFPHPLLVWSGHLESMCVIYCVALCYYHWRTQSNPEEFAAYVPI